jgi:hypothetical protein
VLAELLRGPCEPPPGRREAGQIGTRTSSVASAHRSRSACWSEIDLRTASTAATATGEQGEQSLRHGNLLGAVVVGLTGLEPVASSLSGKRSNRLSYRPAPTRDGVRRDASDYPMGDAPIKTNHAPGRGEPGARRSPPGVTVHMTVHPGRESWSARTSIRTVTPGPRRSGAATRR